MPAKKNDPQDTNKKETGLAVASVMADLLNEFQFQEEDQFAQVEDTSLRLPYVMFPQTMSSGHDIENVKKIFISYTPTDEEAATGVEPIADYVDKLSFIHVSTLVVSDGRYRTGGRQLWHPDPAISEKLCASPNGFAPFASNFGKDVILDKMGGTPYRIGFDANGNPIEDGHFCKKCPLSDWGLAKAKGLNRPLCTENWVYILWTPEYGLVQAAGSNAGLHLAMQGRRGNQTGAAAGGVAIPGLEFFFGKMTGHVDFSRPNISVGMLPYLASYDTKEAKGIPFKMAQTDDPEELLKKLDIGVNYNYRVPTFGYMPEGIPTALRPDVPVMKVKMFKVKNNFKTNAPFVPQFELSDEAWTPEEIESFLKAKKEFIDSQMKQRLMRPELVEAAKDWVSVHAIEVTNETNPALPQGDVVEGEAVDDIL